MAKLFVKFGSKAKKEKKMSRVGKQPITIPQGVKVDFNGKNIKVTVKDNGFGIEKKHQEKIFGKFYRIKDDNTRFITGTGLGLPIVKNLVDNIGGEILLESESGKGTTFTVILPVLA